MESEISALIVECYHLIIEKDQHSSNIVLIDAPTGGDPLLIETGYPFEGVDMTWAMITALFLDLVVAAV